MKSVERLVLRGLLTVAFSVALYWGYTTLMTQRITQTMDAVQASATQNMERTQERQVRLARDAEAHAASRRAEVAASVRAEAEAELMLREQERLKAESWARYYIAPAACDRPATWDFQVECGNQYMRAKRSFEAEWEARDGALPR